MMITFWRIAEEDRRFFFLVLQVVDTILIVANCGGEVDPIIVSRRPLLCIFEPEMWTILNNNFMAHTWAIVKRALLY